MAKKPKWKLQSEAVLPGVKATRPREMTGDMDAKNPALLISGLDEPVCMIIAGEDLERLRAVLDILERLTDRPRWPVNKKNQQRNHK